jgi:uncharacterized protein (DUF1800 family)
VRRDDARATPNGSDAATTRALDTSSPAVTPLELAVPTGVKSGNKVRDVLSMVDRWVQRTQQPDHLVEERMTWFRHDHFHFATSAQKVKDPYLVLEQHGTLREQALGSFADLLGAVARDPAMLHYLDGITNTAIERNETTATRPSPPTTARSTPLRSRAGSVSTPTRSSATTSPRSPASSADVLG